MICKIYWYNGISQAILSFGSSLFYSLYHFLSIIPLFSWPYNIAMILPVFLAGMIWGYMRDKSNSLMGSIVSHILADSGIMAVYLVFLK
ncbi:CPBP family intramembrane glutamic endopeptidase [Brevibacillus brevis]|uniref:CPBP family intramembrane glutamic endopeptidase n=1 Tax=Brevibacillus brevis TaxID=1393 RepID=UPI0037CB2324